MFTERDLSPHDGLLAFPVVEKPAPLPPREIVSRSMTAAQAGKALLAKHGHVYDHNSAERGLYHTYETPRIPVEPEDGEKYEIWLEAGSKSARSFQIMARRGDADYVLYRFRKNRVKDGGRKHLKTASQFENLEEHLRMLRALH